MQWVEHSVTWLVAFIEQLGVLGIFVMAFLESTFLPIPSEVVMIPAGYLVQQGKLDLTSVFVVSVVGTIGGASFNYWLARFLGRGLFLRFGKYFFMPPEKLVELEGFFVRHGAISTFIGRLIPGVRHFISFPAGLAKMDLRVFVIYTALGGAIWMGILIALGYYIGANKELLMTYLPMIKGALVAFIVIVFLGYRWHHKRALKKANT